MRLDSMKSKWIEKSGFFVQPKEIRLRGGESYQYISITKSVKALLQNQELKSLYFQTNANFVPGSIRSFRDGELYKQNKLFSEEGMTNALQLIVYNDDFDTNNPLGDNRKEDKVHAVYFKIGTNRITLS